MIIQGSHMNYGYMQKLQAERNQEESPWNRSVETDDQTGLNPAQFMQINPVNAEKTSAQDALTNAEKGEAQSKDQPNTIGKAFAQEITRRMGEVTGEDGQPKDSSDLEQSLGDTMDWLRERYGDETAAAAAGMILQSTSSGVTEDTLGTGLLNTLKFIDRNFGIAAGDEAIAKFNSGINQAVNEFFDNGQNELFFAVDSSSDATAATQDLNARLISQIAADSEDDTEELGELTEILDELKGELDKIGELQGLVSKLEADFNPTQATTESAMAAYEAMPDLNEPQLTSLTV